MTAKQLANIILRLWGAFWALRSIINFPITIFFAIDMTDVRSRHIALTNALANIIWLALGCVIFFNSEALSKTLFPRDEEPLAIGASADELQRLGFSLIAMYLGATAFAALAGLVYSIRHEPEPFQSPPSVERLVSTIAQLLIAVALFFGSKALARFWERARGLDAE